MSRSSTPSTLHSSPLLPLLDRIMQEHSLSRSQARRWLIEEIDRVTRLKLTNGVSGAYVKTFSIGPTGRYNTQSQKIAIENPKRRLVDPS